MVGLVKMSLVFFHWFGFGFAIFFLVHLSSITVNVHVVWISLVEHGFLSVQGKKGCIVITYSYRLLFIAFYCFAVWTGQGEALLLQFPSHTVVFTNASTVWRLGKRLQPWHLFESNFTYFFLQILLVKSLLGFYNSLLIKQHAISSACCIQNCWFLLFKVCLLNWCETTLKLNGFW